LLGKCFGQNAYSLEKELCAMEGRRQIIERVRNLLPSGVGHQLDMSEESVLSDLGLNSLHLITALLELQREYNLSDEWCTRAPMPCTVGELVTLVERGLSRT
jgi:hypothetical protein